MEILFLFFFFNVNINNVIFFLKQGKFLDTRNFSNSNGLVQCTEDNSKNI